MAAGLQVTVFRLKAIPGTGVTSMSQSKNLSLSFRAVTAGLLLCLCPALATYADDNYLSALEAEADDTGAVSEPAPSISTHKKKIAKHVPAGKVIESGLSFEGFEEILGARYSGSNFLYIKLSKGKRKSVYRFYQNDNRISSVREEIVRLLSSG